MLLYEILAFTIQEKIINLKRHLRHGIKNLN